MPDLLQLNMRELLSLLANRARNDKIPPDKKKKTFTCLSFLNVKLDLMEPMTEMTADAIVDLQYVAI